MLTEQRPPVGSPYAMLPQPSTNRAHHPPAATLRLTARTSGDELLQRSPRPVNGHGTSNASTRFLSANCFHDGHTTWLSSTLEFQLAEVCGIKGTDVYTIGADLYIQTCT